MHDPLMASRPETPFRGALLAVAMRWSDRLLGTLSTLILARLLVPDDFGLVAMATVVVGLLEVLLDLGVSTALVQGDRADSDDFHTAWTLRLAQSAVAAMLVIACAPWVAAYYEDARVVHVLQVIAITVFIGGFENIGTVSFQRNMEFGRDFQFFVWRRLLAVGFTIAAALWLRNYWALVFGGLISRLAGVGLSYRMSAFRPRLSLARFGRIWSVSQWNLLTGIGRYLYGGAGRFVIGGRSGATALGTYTVGEEMAFLPTTELLAPLGRVMFPVFSAAKHDRSELLRVVTLAQSVQALVAIPASVGVALVAGDAIPLLLGDQWRPAVPVSQIMALAGVMVSLTHSIGYMLTSLGRVSTLCMFTWCRLLLLALLLQFVFTGTGVERIALAYLVVGGVTFTVLQAIAGRVLPGFGVRAMLLHAWRPLAASAAMAFVVVTLARILADAGAAWRLIAMVGVGASAYVLCLLVLWRAVGSPDGAETYILGRLTGQAAGIDRPQVAP